MFLRVKGKKWIGSKSLKEFFCSAGPLLKKYAVTYICEFVLSLTLTTKCSRTTLLSCILPCEMCCCLYLRICAVSTLSTRCPFEFAVLYKCWKICWMNPYVSALFAVHLTEKRTGFPKRYFSPKRLFYIFFTFIQQHFLSCKYQFLCLLKTYQSLVIHEWPNVFSKRFVSLLFVSVFWTGR